MNTALMKNPLNWLTILVMLWFVGFILKHSFGGSQSDD